MLNKATGQMYDFVTHTWNTVQGSCPHNCKYCYMTAMRKRFNKGNPEPRFVEKELRTNLGSGNFIFVGSSNDLFADAHPEEWIVKTLDHCAKFDNKYLFQSKNPRRILDFIDHPAMKKAIICTTIESDQLYPQMGKTEYPTLRAIAMSKISKTNDTYVTIEPVMRSNPQRLVELVCLFNPKQVNIGADSGHNKLPEPTKEELRHLIDELSQFTTVKQKSNLKRLL